MKKILFIGHEAERTGAPIVLLHLLRWLKEHRPEFRIEMLLLRDGDLRGSYESVAAVHLVPADWRPEIVVRGLRFLQRKLGIRRRLKIPRIEPTTKNYDLVVGNTVASLEYLEHFKKRGMRTVCWLHEMRSVINSFFPEAGRFLELTRSIDCFIVASDAVEIVLREFGATTRSERVYEFSEIGPIDEKAIAAVRRSLGIPDAAFVVGGSGTLSLRKGADLFVRIASKLSAIEDIYFIWVGGRRVALDREFDMITQEIARLGLDRLLITGTQKEPQNFFANLDVFALTSREDPFPLVCLEAAHHSKPIICFENAGGMPEFVGDDAGAIVPFGDVDTFAERICDYYTNRRKSVAAGQAAYKKINTEFSLASSCRKISELLREMSD